MNTTKIAIGVLPNLWPVIQWLEGGCDPKEAAKELRLYAERIDKGGAPVVASAVPAAGGPVTNEWKPDAPKTNAPRSVSEPLAPARIDADKLHREIEDCPELNLSNYDAVDVERLNDWAIRADAEIDRLRDARHAAAELVSANLSAISAPNAETNAEKTASALDSSRGGER